MADVAYQPYIDDPEHIRAVEGERYVVLRLGTPLSGVHDELQGAAGKPIGSTGGGMWLGTEYSTSRRVLHSPQPATSHRAPSNHCFTVGSTRTDIEIGPFTNNAG